MGAQVQLWRVGDDDELIKIDSARLDLESRLEEWVDRDISILDPELMVIGRQVPAVGGYIDILCINPDGDIVIVELKRDRTPREVTAQALDYASWVADLSDDEVTAIADHHLAPADFESEFKEKFEAELPETLNADHQILIVGSEIDSSSERIMRYLSDSHGVNINAATFHYFRPSHGPELLARVFVLEPSEVERKRRSKRGNLSFEELEALADEANVAELYEYAVAALKRVISWRGRTRSSITFKDDFEGSHQVVISLLPGPEDSNDEDGLRYQLYRDRFAKLAKLPSSNGVENLLPPQHELMNATASPDWQGFQGFIKGQEEIDRLVDAVAESPTRT